VPQALPPRVHAALAAAAARLDAAGVRWVLAGSAGRRLLGHARRPRDVDIEVSRADGPRAAAALGIDLRPAAGGGRSSLRGATVIAGVEVDLSAGLTVEGGGRRLPAYPEVQLDLGTEVQLDHRRITVAPPEEAVARAIVLRDRAALARIAAGAGPGAAPLRRDYVAARLAAAISTASS
jgi:hypothetical protein